MSLWSRLPPALLTVEGFAAEPPEPRRPAAGRGAPGAQLPLLALPHVSSPQECCKGSSVAPSPALGRYDTLF